MKKNENSILHWSSQEMKLQLEREDIAREREACEEFLSESAADLEMSRNSVESERSQLELERQDLESRLLTLKEKVCNFFSCLLVRVSIFLEETEGERLNEVVN